MRALLLLSLLLAFPAYADELPEPTDAPAPEAAAPIEPITTSNVVEVKPEQPATITLLSAVPAFAPWSTQKLYLDLDLVAQGRYLSTPAEDLSDIRLDRGEIGARIALGKNGAAEMRIESVRSAVEGGALGIDGDSMVIRVRYANVNGELTRGKLTVGGALGFVQDPWIRALEDGYTLRPLSRTGSERLLGWSPSDLSALVRAGVGPVRATVTIGNGEGLRFPERNNGKTTTAVLEVVPLVRRDLRVVVAGVGRDGSIGIARVRDRRVGGGATIVTPTVRAGGEIVRAWGLGDRGDVEGTELAAWADARVVEHVYVSARGATLGIDAGRRTTYGGALVVEPWNDPTTRGRFRLWLAVDRITSSGDAMPIPGADPGDATIAMLIASATAPFTLD
ncbi:MAG: hypothetical protein SFX73_40090 [Kofleriaceae bacterium]|nr:hypothetical protein [Kofleriaceae bacterium]